MFQHTAARRRLQILEYTGFKGNVVSTHSRPKAAASGIKSTALTTTFQHTAARRRLRIRLCQIKQRFASFNTQPPEGGCADFTTLGLVEGVSTHSRPKAAAIASAFAVANIPHVSTHSRPKAAASRVGMLAQQYAVSTHSRPKAAAFFSDVMLRGTCSFNTQPPEGGCMGC